MPGNDMTLDEIRKLAGAIGMTRLAPEHLDELLRATQAAYARRGSLPVATLAPADEPAHVLRLPGGGAR
ncbi:MAG: hypothetical protein IT529_12635 [Burkholderiales bacterium]|nr:hypothetical protein [Burkholderiales bacterium]